MYTSQCPLEILRHPVKRQIERHSPSDQHVIVTGAEPACGRAPHNFPQAATNPVTLDSIPDLL
jgi:hypothetical protein